MSAWLLAACRWPQRLRHGRGTGRGIIAHGIMHACRSLFPSLLQHVSFGAMAEEPQPIIEAAEQQEDAAVEPEVDEALHRLLMPWLLQQLKQPLPPRSPCSTARWWRPCVAGPQRWLRAQGTRFEVRAQILLTSPESIQQGLLALNLTLRQRAWGREWTRSRTSLGLLRGFTCASSMSAQLAPFDTGWRSCKRIIQEWCRSWSLLQGGKAALGGSAAYDTVVHFQKCCKPWQAKSSSGRAPTPTRVSAAAQAALALAAWRRFSFLASMLRLARGKRSQG